MSAWRLTLLSKIYYVIVVEIKKIMNINTNSTSQVALLLTICSYLMDDECKYSSGELRMMLYDAIDLIQ